MERRNLMERWSLLKKGNLYRWKREKNGRSKRVRRKGEREQEEEGKEIYKLRGREVPEFSPEMGKSPELIVEEERC